MLLLLLLQKKPLPLLKLHRLKPLLLLTTVTHTKNISQRVPL